LRFRGVGPVAAADNSLGAADFARLESIVSFCNSFEQANPMNSPFLIRPQAPADADAVDHLHEEAFGPGRFARSAYRVREASSGPQIAFTAWQGEVLVGAIQLTAVTIGGCAGAMLLGPLAITPAYKGKGGGLALIVASISAAEAAGKRLIVLVGDLPYYKRAGFAAVRPGQIVFPGPADPARILALELELEPGALDAYSGLIAADNTPLKHGAGKAAALRAQPGDEPRTFAVL
jgi:predicted N-acetyltransferase YhbS